MRRLSARAKCCTGAFVFVLYLCIVGAEFWGKNHQHETYPLFGGLRLRHLPVARPAHHRRDRAQRHTDQPDHEDLRHHPGVARRALLLLLPRGCRLYFRLQRGNRQTSSLQRPNRYQLVHRADPDDRRHRYRRSLMGRHPVRQATICPVARARSGPGYTAH